MAEATLDQLLDILRHSKVVDELVGAFEAVDRVAQPDDVPVLLDALREEDNFYLREAVAAPLIRLRGLAVLPELLLAHEMGLHEGHDNDTLDFMITELVEQQAQQAAPMLLAMLADGPAERRAEAAWLLGYARAATSAEPLIVAMRDRSAKVRSNAVGSLASFRDEPGVFDALASATGDSSESVRVSAAASLGYFGDARAIHVLESLRADPSPNVQRHVHSALRNLVRDDENIAP